MLRPLLTALHADKGAASCLFTTATHAAGLFEEFCSPTKAIVLPRDAGGLLPVLRQWRHCFDLLYVGPYQNLKTRILARLLQPKKILSGAHAQAHPFMLEQVLHDCRALGLTCEHAASDFKTFLPWPVEDLLYPCPGQQPFVVLHAGAKQRWETTRWPTDRWRRLTLRILEDTRYAVCLVGVASEKPVIEQITSGLPAHVQSRIHSCISWPVRDTARLINASSGVICHNSGILHLAAFLGKKTVCITGSSARYWRPPYPWVENATSGACGLACNRYTCPVPFYRAKCIKLLTVEAVWDAVQGHLAPGGLR